MSLSHLTRQMKSNLSTCSLKDFVFVVISKKSLLNLNSKRFSHIFSFRSLRFLGVYNLFCVTFCIRCEVHTQNSVFSRVQPQFIFLGTDYQFLQHHVLKRLSFLQSTILALSSKII